MRKPKGLVNVISDADNFVISFPPTATPLDKFMIVGAVLLIDYRYYEEIALLKPEMAQIIYDSKI